MSLTHKRMRFLASNRIPEKVLTRHQELLKGDTRYLRVMAGRPLRVMAGHSFRVMAGHPLRVLAGRPLRVMAGRPLPRHGRA